MLGALAEAQAVLADRGVAWDTNTRRTMASRYAARARLGQQGARTGCEAPVAGRRVVRRRDGGRRRRREPTRGPKPQTGRRRSTGAWRAPQVLRVSVVHAAGQREASVAPCLDATLTGPEAGCARRRTAVQRLALTPADPVLCSADGAPWRGQRVPLWRPA
jgi:hypothetical protein